MDRQEQLESMDDDELDLIIHSFEHPRGNNYLNFFNELDPSEYCQNPEDIMPLAVENGISLEYLPCTEEWCAQEAKELTKRAFNNNPYRAVCIVLIVLKEGEKR